MIALWNNFRALGAKLGVAAPEDPLYLLKANSCFTDPGAIIPRPASYGGKVVYEGELGIVIGRICKDATEEEARACIFGYTCVNDLTAADILNKDPNFPQWVRAKSFDGFGPFGPAIATEVTPEDLWVRTILNGVERQRYPISDMVFPAAELVSRISRDMIAVAWGHHLLRDVGGRGLDEPAEKSRGSRDRRHRETRKSLFSVGWPGSTHGCRPEEVFLRRAIKSRRRLRCFGGEWTARKPLG